MANYFNGELITKDRMQNEDWYSDFQALCEIMCTEELFYEEIENGREKALLVVKDYFKMFPGPPNWLKPNDEQILRWIDSVWLSADSIEKIKTERIKK